MSNPTATQTVHRRRHVPQRTRRMLAAGALAVVVAACGTATDAIAPVAPDRAETLIESTEGLVVLDIRTPEEIATGVLPEAIGLDFYSDTFADELAELDRDTPYLVYCRSGNRSGQAMDIMTDLGFTEVYELTGGINSWIEQGKALTDS